MKDFFRQLLSSTEGQGPSSTRLIYLLNGLAASFCATVATVAGLIVYCYCRKAEPTYWAAVAALWTTTLGFGTSAKNAQAEITKEKVKASTPPSTAVAHSLGD